MIARIECIPKKITSGIQPTKYSSIRLTLCKSSILVTIGESVEARVVLIVVKNLLTG